ncbi:MAG: hypothetical protein JWN28_604 [Candidatus Saccharibacteria bacterium]|nr:hypothetical protein [Candidatus Saccharibacteria bacterium]
MNEMDNVPQNSYSELSNEYIRDYVKQSDANWCLRHLALVASRRIEGDADDAVQRIYESSGGITILLHSETLLNRLTKVYKCSIITLSQLA